MNMRCFFSLIPINIYDNLPLLKCGYNEDNINTASPDDMEKYYSKEKQNQFGVIGIEISLL